MYKVSYYMTGGTLSSRIFETLAQATDFMVYKISSWDVYECYRMD
jgi:hypothetical protein